MMMATQTRFRWAIAVSAALALGLLVQGWLLWQTRQELAQLRPDEAELSPIEQRILADLEAQERDRQARIFDPLSSSIFSTDPFDHFQQMQQRMDRLFGGLGNSPAGFGFSVSSPDIVLDENEQEFRLLIKVPEQHEIDLNTRVEYRQVTVSGKITAQADNSGNGFASQFSSHSQFARTFDLGWDVDALGVHTEQTEEGLAVVLPKKQISSSGQSS